MYLSARSIDFHDCIISLRGKICANKTSLTPSLFFIEVPVSSLESERSCKICVLVVVNLCVRLLGVVNLCVRGREFVC